MPKGPTGQKRPGDVIGTAIKVAKIATGEVEDESMAGKEYAQKGGLKGGVVPRKQLGWTVWEKRKLAVPAGSHFLFTWDGEWDKN